MRKINNALILLVLLLLVNSNLFAQKDTLFIYTKPDCSNCQATKKALNQIGIGYLEKDLNNAENAKEMLHKLALLGFKDKIFLPVLFLNKSIYHPAFANKKGLVLIDIESAIDSLKHRYFKGDLHLFTNVNSISESTNNQQITPLSDCELKTTQQYIICASYASENEAVEAMKKLIANGYSYAGVIYSENKFLVYNKFFFDKYVANKQLVEEKKIFSNAYLYEN